MARCNDGGDNRKDSCRVGARQGMGVPPRGDKQVQRKRTQQNCHGGAVD